VSSWAPVYAVVACHQSHYAGFLDGALERQNVELTQGALGDLRTHAHALMFALVADVALDRRRHAGRLQPAHIGYGQFGRQPRIFGATFEIAAVVDRALQVDGGREQHPCAFELGLDAKRHAGLFDQHRVPSGAQRNTHGEARSTRAVLEDATARAVRTIGELDCRHT
jgi:hypothetical protein